MDVELISRAFANGWYLDGIWLVPPDAASRNNWAVKEWRKIRYQGQDIYYPNWIKKWFRQNY